MRFLKHPASLIFAIKLVCVPASRAHTFVIPPKIAELTNASDLIVLAKVEWVRGNSLFQNRRAKAKVAEVWKGSKVDTVEYSLWSENMCDTSDAKPEETVLLFLEKDENARWRIAWSGRGRMPLATIEGKSHLAYHHVIFPEEITRTRVPRKNEEEDDGFDTAIEMKVVEKLVREAIAKDQTTSPKEKSLVDPASLSKRRAIKDQAASSKGK